MGVGGNILGGAKFRSVAWETNEGAEHENKTVTSFNI